MGEKARLTKTKQEGMYFNLVEMLRKFKLKYGLTNKEYNGIAFEKLTKDDTPTNFGKFMKELRDYCNTNGLSAKTNDEAYTKYGRTFINS